VIVCLLFNSVRTSVSDASCSFTMSTSPQWRDWGQAMRCPFTHPTGGGGRDSGVPPAHLHQPQTWCGGLGPTSTMLCNEVTDAYMSLQPEQQQSVTIGCSCLVQQTLSYSLLCLLVVKYFGLAVLRPSRGNLPPCAAPLVTPYLT